MAGAEGADTSGESKTIAALRHLSLEDLPGLEILLLDDLAAWASSADNPGHGYGEDHGGLVISALLSAVERAGSFRSIQTPAESREIVAAREKVVAGAHELADAADGLTLLTTQLMPAAIGELRRNAGQPTAQAYWLYYYSLLLLASGTEEDAGDTAMRGITEAFDAWNRLMADGFVPSWRREQDGQPRNSDNRSSPRESQVSAEMVTSHVETLIERLTGVEKARADHDGDYPIRYRNALYFVRVTQPGRPVVQVFSIAVDDVPLTTALTRDLNEINSKLHFCRTFWVLGQVLIEAEHLGATLSEADFDECAFNVAEATDAFASELARQHGGRLAFDEAKTPEYTPPADEVPGCYL
jgi:hypothetical protein